MNDRPAVEGRILRTAAQDKAETEARAERHAKLAEIYRRDEEWRSTPRGREVSDRKRRPLLAALVLSVVGLPFALGASVSQQLAWARLGIAGSLESPLGGPVTVTAPLPSGYGLTPREQREDWPALNHVNEQHAALSGRFTLELPRIYYCVFRFVWRPLPPPPAGFIVRFSDAPAEEYSLWSDRGRSGYVVRSSGIEVPREQATWRLDLGPFERVADEPKRPPLWLLRVRFEHQRSESLGS